jgi:cytochrome P450
VQRASRSLSFTPLVPDITERVLGLDKGTIDIVRQNLDPQPGEERGFLADIHDMLYGYLGPGEPLNEISRTAAQELSDQLRLYASSRELAGSFPEEVDLLLWIRHFVTIGTAAFLYGPKNPIAVQPDLENAFWDFDHGLGGLLVNMYPSLTAAKAYRGREALAKALTAYLKAGYHQDASRIVKNRVRVAEEYDWSVEMTARSELSFLFAGIVNTATTVFWVVLQIFANGELLQAIRDELEDARRNTEENAGPGKLSIEVVKNSCPTLVAVFRECLRVGSENFSTRLVKADTMLADKYFLKKDSVVQIAGGVIHADKDIWGEDVQSFNPRRFLKQQEGRQNAIHPAAFRAFGGGKTLCPGRHFATNEILMFAAMIVMNFDLSALNGGTIYVPPKYDGVMPVHILEPHSRDAVKVLVRPRSNHLFKELEVVS